MIANRLMVALATLRLSARDVAELKKFFSGRPSGAVLAILHQIEDEIEDGRFRISDVDRDASSPVVDELEHRLRQIYQGELAIPVTAFMHALISAATAEGKNVTKFDPKKGLRAWLEKNLPRLPPSEMMRFATLIGHSSDREKRSWRLR